MTQQANEHAGAQTFLADPDGRLIVVGPNGGSQLVDVGAGGSATATLTNVSGSASSVTVLAANTARIGASVYNDSAAILYLKCGATASTTSFTYEAAPNAYYEVPFGYTGKIDGIWASATGAARVTEFTT